MSATLILCFTVRIYVREVYFGFQLGNFFLKSEVIALGFENILYFIHRVGFCGVA